MENCKSKSITLAYYLLILLPAIIVISPSATAVIEVALYILFLSNQELRERFLNSLTQPFIIFGFLLFSYITLSAAWSEALLETQIEHIISWRKILLLPIAASLVNTPLAKRQFIIIFICFISLYASISWTFYLLDFSSYKSASQLLRNHTTQGIVFFVAAFSAISLLVNKEKKNAYFITLLVISISIILSNSLVISTSRSSYVILIVLTVCAGVYFGRKKAIFIVPILLTIVAILLATSPTSNARILKMWNEITHSSESTQITSGGARVIFMRNTIPIILNAPIFGHGLKSMPIKYAEQITGEEGWKSTVTTDPHNQYLLFLAEQGIIGLCLFLTFICYCFKQNPPLFYKYIGLSVLLGWLATSLFNGHFSSSVEGKFIFLWCGAMLSSATSRDQPINT